MRSGWLVVLLFPSVLGCTLEGGGFKWGTGQRGTPVLPADGASQEGTRSSACDAMAGTASCGFKANALEDCPSDSGVDADGP